MMVNIKIPIPLRKFTNQQGEVQAEGNTIIELIGDLDKKFPGIGQRILDDKGEIRKFINVYIGEEDIRFLNGKETKVGEKEVLIVPSIAGG